MWNDDMIERAVFPERFTEREDVQPVVYLPAGREDYGPIENSQIQPASLDVRLAADFIRHPDGEHMWADGFRPYPLSPGECVLGSTVERLDMPDNVVARVEGKSSLARIFLTVHSAGFIDPGFRGDVTLELKNDGMVPLRLVPGMLIAQISFQTLDAPALRPYGHEGLNSHYQGQVGPRQTRLGGN